MTGLDDVSGRYVAKYRSTCRGREPRSGSAPLEFVMVLFAMVWFFLMLLWMGAVWTNESYVAVVARYEAWEQRDAQKASPFEMDDAGQGGVTKASEYPISLSPLVDNRIVPRASHTVYGGAWQSPHVDLNRSPNWRLDETLIRKAGTQKADELGRVVDGLSEMPSAVSDAIADKVADAMGELNPLWSRLEASERQATSENEAKVRDDEEKSKANLRQRQREIRSEVLAAERRLQVARDGVSRDRMAVAAARDELKKEEGSPNKDEEKIKQLKKRIAELEEKIRVREQVEIPDLMRGISRLKKADSDIERSLGQVNGG